MPIETSLWVTRLRAPHLSDSDPLAARVPSKLRLDGPSWSTGCRRGDCPCRSATSIQEGLCLGSSCERTTTRAGHRHSHSQEEGQSCLQVGVLYCGWPGSVKRPGFQTGRSALGTSRSGAESWDLRGRLRFFCHRPRRQVRVPPWYRCRTSHRSDRPGIE